MTMLSGMAELCADRDGRVVSCAQVGGALKRETRKQVDNNNKSEELQQVTAKGKR